MESELFVRRLLDNDNDDDDGDRVQQAGTRRSYFGLEHQKEVRKFVEVNALVDAFEATSVVFVRW